MLIRQCSVTCLSVALFIGVERESDSEDSDSNSGSVAADATPSRYIDFCKNIFYRSSG